jgi:hypothetical protein
MAFAFCKLLLRGDSHDSMVRSTSGGEMKRITRLVTYAVLLAGISIFFLTLAEVSTVTRYRESWFLAATLLIVLGLVISSEATLSSKRNELTIRLIGDFVSNHQRVEDRQFVRKTQPWPHVIQFGNPNFDDTDNQFLLALGRELDFLDTVAYAIFSGAAEEIVLRSAFDRLVMEDVTQFSPFITHSQSGKRPRWRHLVALADRWSRRGP